MIKVFTSFSGYDSQCLALQYLGLDYELVGWSEIDKYAIQAHDALFPQWKDRNYGDISGIDWAQVPDFDLFTYSSPCQDFSNAGLQKGGEAEASLARRQGGEVLRREDTEGGKIIGAVTQTFGVSAFRNGWKLIIKDMAKKYRIRKLTPTECFKLMGVRDADVKVLRECGVSESQQYKMAGNSIVVDVLMGIFQQMFDPKYVEESSQLSLW